MSSVAEITQATTMGLSKVTLIEGLQHLSHRDPDLGFFLDDLGAAPLWSRELGFATLVYIILEQQVSLAPAESAYDWLLAIVSPLTSRRFLEIDDIALKRIGFSRQKGHYSRHPA